MYQVINISRLIREVPHEVDFKSVQTVLFDRKTAELVKKVDVLAKLNIADDEFVPFDYDYLPLFEISLADTQRDFLLASNRKDCAKILKMNLDDSQLEFYFRKELEISEISTFWWQHHLKIVKYKAIEWCEDYGIPYFDDCQTIKPIQMCCENQSM